MFLIKTPFITASHVLRRSGATYSPSGKSKASPIFVDSDTSALNYVPAASGTTKRVLVTTAAGQTQTSPVLVTPSGVVTFQEALFTQIAGATTITHTATFTIPAGATILDIYVTASATWNSGTSAVLNIGLVDTDCFFAAIALHTPTIAAGKTVNFSNPGGKNGASVPAIDGGGAATFLGAANGFLYNAAAQSLTAVVLDTNVAGTLGRTRVGVLYALPSSVVAATAVVA